MNNDDKLPAYEQVFHKATPSSETPQEEIDRRFVYHSPKPGQPEKYEAIRNKAKELAELLITMCPSSRELDVAMTELETAVFWANASIARNE